MVSFIGPKNAEEKRVMQMKIESRIGMLCSVGFCEKSKLSTENL